MLWRSEFTSSLPPVYLVPQISLRRSSRPDKLDVWQQFHLISAEDVTVVTTSHTSARSWLREIDKRDLGDPRAYPVGTTTAPESNSTSPGLDSCYRCHKLGPSVGAVPIGPTISPRDGHMCTHDAALPGPSSTGISTYQCIHLHPPVMAPRGTEPRELPLPSFFAKQY